MDKARRSSSSTMAASNGVTQRRRRILDGLMHQEVVTVRDRPEKKERDPESLNRSKRRRSERFAPRNERDLEEDSSGESHRDEDVQHNYHRKSFPRHASSLKVPRKARSACIKRSHDCRTSSGSGGGGLREDRRRAPTSSGSYSFEVVSPSSSKQKKIVNGSKSRIPKPPKSSGTIDDDLEIEIAEVLTGLKKQPRCSKREDDSENSLKSSEVKGAKKLKLEGDDSSAGVVIGGLNTCTARIQTGNLANTDKSSKSDIHKEKEVRQVTASILDGVQEDQRLDSAMSIGVTKGPPLENNRDESNCTSKLEINLMVPPTMPSSPERASLIPLVSDSIVTEDHCKPDSSLYNKDRIIVKNEMKVEKHELLNLDIERPNQVARTDSSLRLQNLDWSRPQQANSGQQSSVLLLPVAVGGWPSGLPPQGYVPVIHTGKPVDGSNGSSTLVQPRPKRCATHFFIARNIQLHQHFVKTNHPSTPNKASFYLKGGDMNPAAANQSLQGSSSILSLNSQAQDTMSVHISESGYFGSTRQKKPQPPPDPASSIVPAPAFIFPTNQHLQPVMVPSKSPRQSKIPNNASVNFSHPSSSASEASSPYFTVLPNNAYSFQLPSSTRGGTPNQALSFFNGSFYSPQMFQPPQILQKQSQAQRGTKASSCSSSSHRQPQVQPQVCVNSFLSQASANVQRHRQQSHKSDAKAAGDNSDSRGSHTQKGGPYGQIMTAPAQPQNFSMSFAGGAAPANLNFSTNGYHLLSAPPVVHQKNHQASDSKTGGGSCANNAEDPKKTPPGKPPAMMNGQTLVFDSPSRTLNFVSGTWPPPSATTINGDPSVFTQHLPQRQQQSGRSKLMTHLQADSVSATSSQWRNPATSSLTSLNLKQFQSQQQMRTHRQTQISFAAPSKSQQPSQGLQGRSGGSSSSSVTMCASHGKATNPKASNSKALPLSPVPSLSAHAQGQTEISVSGPTQKTSPVCGRTMPPIITSCPGHLSELKY